MSLLAHARVGTGSRAVFLLHGFLGSARNLATLARGLTQRLPDRSATSLDLSVRRAEVMIGIMVAPIPRPMMKRTMMICG